MCKCCSGGKDSSKYKKYEFLRTLTHSDEGVTHSHEHDHEHGPHHCDAVNPHEVNLQHGDEEQGPPTNMGDDKGSF